jgi:hypothetical protein
MKPGLIVTGIIKFRLIRKTFLNRGLEKGMFEYCSVAYGWIGRGWTQAISWLRIKGQEMIE